MLEAALRSPALHALLFAVVCLGALTPEPGAAKEKAAAPNVMEQITSTLDRQVAAWNRGDLEAFCAVYAPDATFVSPKGVKRGRDTVLAGYRERYPDHAAMGTLKLEAIDTRTVEWGLARGRAYTASLVGRFTLTFPDREPVQGWTLLVLQRQGGVWQIVQDASFKSE